MNLEKNRIVVLALGGGGIKTMSRLMTDMPFKSVDCWCADTYAASLENASAPNRLLLGESVIHGMGAGGDVRLGRKAAEASINELYAMLDGAHQVIIVGGMGGGTATGAAPVVTRIASEIGAQVCTVISRPFSFEGSQRAQNAEHGIAALQGLIDPQNLLIVPGDRLASLHSNARMPTMQQVFSWLDAALTWNVLARLATWQ